MRDEVDDFLDQYYREHPRHFFLQLGDGPEREVTIGEWVAAERAAGFYNTMGRPDEPATGAFHGRGISGRIAVESTGGTD